MRIRPFFYLALMPLLLTPGQVFSKTLRKETTPSKKHSGLIASVDIEKREFTLDTGRRFSWDESTEVTYDKKSYKIKDIQLRKDLLVGISANEGVAEKIDIRGGVAGGNGCGDSECPCAITPPDCSTNCCPKKGPHN
jgi:hypothetical protein